MYKELHDLIIARAKDRFLKDNFETHHIIPRYMNGTNDISNLVNLTYREHCAIHFLLWKIYGNLEDKCAFRLMYKIGGNRKNEISKMIGEKHVKSGHIQALGQKNKDSGWILQIRTKESMSKGGKRGGAIAKESGQINSIKTDESCFRGGKTAGNLAKEKGQIQSIAKYKGIYVLIMPDGTEFLHAFEAEKYMNLPSNTISQRCYANALGYTRRLKLPEERGMNGVLISR
jgi:hypothetical protein